MKGSSRYACTTMFPLLTAGSPRQATVPPTLFAGRAASGAMVMHCACEAANQGVPWLAASPTPPPNWW